MSVRMSGYPSIHPFVRPSIFNIHELLLTCSKGFLLFNIKDLIARPDIFIILQYTMDIENGQISSTVLVLSFILFCTLNLEPINDILLLQYYRKNQKTFVSFVESNWKLTLFRMSTYLPFFIYLSFIQGVQERQKMGISFCKTTRKEFVEN